MEDKLTVKQQKFCREYVVDFNGTQAAIRAGYAKASARTTASELLTKDHVSKQIKVLLDEIGLGPDETKKLISDIARSNLNEYFTIRKVEYTPKIVKSLKQLIQETKEEIEFEEEFAASVALSEDEMKSHLAMQHARELKIVRYELELKRNPKAFRIVMGETTLVDYPELDMAKLVADKELGKIKSITPGQWGTKVEMYAVDAALTTLAKIHGLFAPEKIDATNNTTVHVAITKEDIDLFKQAFSADYK